MVSIYDEYKTEEERINFLKGLVRVSRADSVISPEEEVFFFNVASGLSIPPSYIEVLKEALQDKTIELSVSFNNRRQSLFFIKEAIQLGYVDNTFSKLEREEVLKIANELSIAAGTVETIEKWVVEGMEWVERGEKLISKLAED